MGTETYDFTSETGIPRAEELIAETYRQVLAIREKGSDPVRVIMNRRLWSLIDDYRQSLGPLEGDMPDYLSENSLFGLEIWYGDDPEIRVE